MGSNMKSFVEELNAVAIEKLGKRQRLDKTIEELVELAHVLGKVKKLQEMAMTTRSDQFLAIYPELISEIADVAIMMTCLTHTLGISEQRINEQVAIKVEKFKVSLERLNG